MAGDRRAPVSSLTPAAPAAATRVAEGVAVVVGEGTGFAEELGVGRGNAVGVGEEPGVADGLGVGTGLEAGDGEGGSVVGWTAHPGNMPG